MNSRLLERLFRAQAQATIAQTAAVLSSEITFPLSWEDFFRRVHDLKAQALAADMKVLAKELHQLEDLLWAKRDDFKALQTAQAILEEMFRRNDELDAPLPVREVLTLLAEQATKNGQEIGKTLDIRVTTEGLRAQDNMLPALYPALVHLLHNAITHGVGTVGMIWLHAYHENWHLVIEVEDDGGERDSSARLPSMLSGRGVGLSSIRSIMKDLKGDITLEDSQRGGTKARLRLPLPKPERKVS